MCISGSLVSSLLQDTTDDSSLSDWLYDGLKLHRTRETTRCLFCRQEIHADRLTALEAHFSAEYNDLIQRIEDVLQPLNDYCKRTRELRVPSVGEFYDDLAKDFEAGKFSFEGMLKKILMFLDALDDIVEEKRRRPFDRIEASFSVPQLDESVVERINELIRTHNAACEQFEERATNARQKLATAMIEEGMEEYKRLADAEHAAKSNASHCRTNLARLAEDIAALEQDILEHRLPADELNEDLHRYLGHDELKLEVKDTGYILMRRGVVAESPSDGERTALALLYFLKSLSDKRFDIEKGVVVLDDPVSSLDANALYLAFGYIRERTQDAGQLFLLTHNFTLFRLSRNWFHRLSGQNKKDISKQPARLYMLERDDDNTTRRMTIQKLDPLLERYESEYHYLFSIVHREAHSGVPTTMERAYHLPNVARRVLEMFLAFRQPQAAGELWNKMKAVDFDEARKLRIVRFVHTHSHGDTISEPEHDPSVLGEARSVLADLMELMRAEDPKHYSGMLEVVRETNEPEEDG